MHVETNHLIRIHKTRVNMHIGTKTTNNIHKLVVGMGAAMKMIYTNWGGK